MKRILLPLLFLFLLSFGLASAQLCEEYQSVVGEQIPKNVPFANEAIQVTIIEEGTTFLVLVQEGTITAVECDPISEPTVIVEITNQAVIQNIASAQSPLDAFVNAKKDGSIVIKGTTAWKKTKLFFVKTGVRIGSWFA